VTGSEHWARKPGPDGESARLFLWRKRTLNSPNGALLFTHGSAVPAKALFDLQVEGRPEASTMDWFARLGYDTWCVDAGVSSGAEDLGAASEQVMRVTGQRPFLYGVGAGALHAGLFTERYPDRVRRLALDMTPSAATDELNLAVLDPARIVAPTLVMHGALAPRPPVEELAGFFTRLANADKQLAALPGIGETSTLSKNWALVYHLLDSFFSQPPPAFAG
jgi:pimeloyl-ACP methyl ester carboxylesterase